MCRLLFLNSLVLPLTLTNAMFYKIITFDIAYLAHTENAPYQRHCELKHGDSMKQNSITPNGEMIEVRINKPSKSVVLARIVSSFVSIFVRN